MIFAAWQIKGCVVVRELTESFGFMNLWYFLGINESNNLSAAPVEING